MKLLNNILIKLYKLELNKKSLNKLLSKYKKLYKLILLLHKLNKFKSLDKRLYKYLKLYKLSTLKTIFKIKFKLLIDSNKLKFQSIQLYKKSFKFLKFYKKLYRELLLCHKLYKS